MRKSSLKKKIEPKVYGKCAWHGCKLDACYPAPKYRSSKEAVEATPERIYFCLDHVREYNSSWDFFGGMSQKEIERFQKDAIIGHRPTRKIRKYRVTFDKALFDFEEMFENSGRNDNQNRLPDNEKQALAVLDLEFPVTMEQIKIRYKTLVKLYHPDLNGGDKAAEEKFKVVTCAYKLLLNSSFLVA